MKRSQLWAFIIIAATIIIAYYLNNSYKTNPFKLGLDLNGGIHLVYKAKIDMLKPEDVADSMATLKNVIENRVNAFGVSEPLVQTEGKDKLIVEIPGVDKTEEAIALIGQTPTLNFAVIEEVSTTTPGTTTISVQTVLKPTELTGKYLTDSRVEYDPNTGKPMIGLTFNSEGADIFASTTKNNIGKRIAILLDNNIISAPTVNSEITGGRAQITGMGSVREAKDIVRGLKYGALPVSIDLVGTQTIGATLGTDAVTASKKAGIYSFILVSVFMIFWYRFRGFTAVIALAVYVILNLLMFRLTGVVLTSAGLAAFIISIGMAVDGNILIYERVKEERKRGLRGKEAIEAGFKRAWPSIRDSNISSIITGILLYSFASSPLIQGFAFVFIIGVFVSMITSYYVSKTLLLAISIKK